MLEFEGFFKSVLIVFVCFLLKLLHTFISMDRDVCMYTLNHQNKIKPIND